MQLFASQLRRLCRGWLCRLFPALLALCALLTLAGCGEAAAPSSPSIDQSVSAQEPANESVPGEQALIIFKP